MRDGCKFISDNKVVHEHFVRHVKELNGKRYSPHDIGNIIIDGKEKKFVIAGKEYPIGELPFGTPQNKKAFAVNRLSPQESALLLCLNRALYCSKLDNLNWVVDSRSPFNIYSISVNTKKGMDERIKWMLASNRLGVEFLDNGRSYSEVITGAEFTNKNSLLVIQMDILDTEYKHSPNTQIIGRNIRLVPDGTLHLGGNTSLNHSDGVLYAMMVTGWGTGDNSYPKEKLRAGYGA